MSTVRCCCRLSPQRRDAGSVDTRKGKTQSHVVIFVERHLQRVAKVAEGKGMLALDLCLLRRIHREIVQVLVAAVVDDVVKAERAPSPVQCMSAARYMRSWSGRSRRFRSEHAPQPLGRDAGLGRDRHQWTPPSHDAHGPAAAGRKRGRLASVVGREVTAPWPRNTVRRRGRCNAGLTDRSRHYTGHVPTDRPRNTVRRRGRCNAGLKDRSRHHTGHVPTDRPRNMVRRRGRCSAGLTDRSRHCTGRVPAYPPRSTARLRGQYNVGLTDRSHRCMDCCCHRLKRCSLGAIGSGLPRG
jgi:hypothetical protein